MAGAGQGRSDDLPVVWAPQPGPQTHLIRCPVFEILYGGARGGGKTDGMLGKWALKAERYSQAVGVFFRRTREDLKEAKERSKAIYYPLGAELVDNEKQWIFPSGARLKFAYLDNDRDADNYQGHNYTDLFFEELTHWPSPDPINKLKATLRSAYGVPCQFHGTANPGGPGHQWVKARYITPAPHGWQLLWEEFKNPFTGEAQRLPRIFIPSRLTDNPLLLNADPLYVAKLHQAGSAALVRAWLMGDWDVVEGAYFDVWSTSMVLRPFEIPSDWTRFRSFDWGSARPFSVGWWAIAPDDYDTGAQLIPKNSIIRYREWYGASAPNVGLKMMADEIARGIKEREQHETIKYGVADPSIWKAEGGPSIAERMAREGVTWRAGDNKRIPGWDQVRQRMQGIDGRPKIYFFSTCIDSIRTIPALQHDTAKPEDVDSEGEDHAADEVRYACMSRPLAPRPVTQPKRDERLSLNNLLRLDDERNTDKRNLI